jgi:hypothetical protein
MRERFYSDPQLQPRAEGLAFPIWSYLSCYPARFMASPRDQLNPVSRPLAVAGNAVRVNKRRDLQTRWRSLSRRSC